MYGLIACKEVISMLYLTFVSALFLIGLFSSLPLISSYTSKLIFDSKLIDNTSKIDFEKTMLGKDINKKSSEVDGLILKNHLQQNPTEPKILL